MQEFPSNLPVAEWLAAAVSLLVEGKHSQAEYTLQSILACSPENAEALHYLGVLRHQQRRDDEAVALLQRAISLCPTYTAAYNNLGNILRTLGRDAEADAAYRQAIRISPRNPAAYNNLGILYTRKGLLPEAEAMLRQAIALDAERGEPYASLADNLALQGRSDDAIAAYQQAIELSPRLTSAYVELAGLLGEHNRFNEAATVYRRLLLVEPQHPIGQHMLAACTGGVVPARASDLYLQHHFDGFAATFNSVLSAIGYQGPQMVISALSREIEPRAQHDVLDVGCGTGLCGALLRPYARHLAGVDLSHGMLDQAMHRGVYDTLIQSEATTFLREHPRAWDVIAGADVLIYFGELEELAAAIAAALRPGGFLAMTAEDAEERGLAKGWHLEPSGRYSHSEAYLRAVLGRVGLDVRWSGRDVLRTERGKPVKGIIILAKSPT